METTLSSPVLVGELNPYGCDPAFALYPAPAGCSGERFCNLILGMTTGAYLKAFDRVNLVTGPRWSLPAAREAAARLRADCPGRRMVLLGVKVAQAFGIQSESFRIVKNFLLLPHPSGLNRVWSEPGSIGKARMMMALFAPELEPVMG
jgi:hypothetical protein